MAMNELRKEVEAAAMAELNRANAKFPLFNSTHEGYGAYPFKSRKHWHGNNRYSGGGYVL